MNRTGTFVMLVWAASVLLGTAGARAGPCNIDADCGDGDDCNGVETCGYDGECRPGAGLCGPLTGVFGTQVTASSTYSQAYSPSNVIDGVDEPDSSWCSARNDPAPAIAIEWSIAVSVEEIRVMTSWSPSYDFLTGRFLLQDASGATLHDSGTVAFSGGEVTVPVTPAVTGVRRVEMVGETWRSSDPCLSEIEVSGTLSCATDADCAFVSPCIGVGICLPTGSCSASAPRCRNLAISHASVSASSWDAPYFPVRAVDGVDSPLSSWCSQPGDAAPTFTLTLPNEHPIDIVRITDPWTGYELLTGVITIEDSSGAAQFDSGTVTFDHGAADLVLASPVAAAHVIHLEALTTLDVPCIGELELLGEYCGIAITQADPMTIAFRPGTPTPEFELRYGQLSDLLADGGFDHAACLGRYSAESIPAPLPDPALGDGYYLIGRAFNVCAVEGFGMSMATPDPRAALAATPACQP